MKHFVFVCNRQYWYGGLNHAIFFGARDAVVGSRTHRMLSRWQLLLFSFMLRNSVRAVDLFHIPTRNFVEVGRQIEI